MRSERKRKQGKRRAKMRGRYEKEDNRPHIKDRKRASKRTMKGKSERENNIGRDREKSKEIK